MGIGIRNHEGYVDKVPFTAISNIIQEDKAALKPAFRPLVYMCTPFYGDVERNKNKLLEFAEFAYESGCIPLTAQLLYPFIKNTDEENRRTILHMNIVLMGKCQEVWVLAEHITSGMYVEINKAKKRRQKIRYFNNQLEEVFL